MPDPVKTVAEAPEKAPVQDEAVDQVSDAEVDALAADAQDAETSDAAEDSSPSEKTDDGSELSEKAKDAIESAGEEDADDLSEFDAPVEKTKDNVQKRIDQLTAQIKELKAENDKLKTPEEKKSSDKPQYTEAQLKAALKKAFDEGDHELAMEIFDYKVGKAQEDLIKMYNDERNKAVEGQKAVVTEWNKVCNDYSKVWADDDGKEIYPNAKNELSLGSESSLLYRLALKMYTESRDENGRLIYNTQGGQRQAVADAVTQILRKRRTSADPAKKVMERKLAKAKRKASIPSTSSTEGGDTAKLRSSGDKLQDYLSERKKFLNERK
jgi:hypothetical protein